MLIVNERFFEVTLLEPLYSVHYDAVFTPTPQDVTVRLIMILVCCYGYISGCLDFSTAYLYADIPEDEQVPVEYPKEARRFDKKGRKLYMRLRRNIYGHPAGARRWGQHRSKMLLEEFNSGGWKCWICEEDPCLLIFISPRGTRSFVSIWTDDADGAYATQEDKDEIKAGIKKHFKITTADETHQLSIVREHFAKDGVNYVRLTQVDYIEDMAASFADYLPRQASTPVPHRLRLDYEESKSRPTREHDAVHARGYLRAVGLLLWCYRRTMPQLGNAIAMLTQHMSCPTEEAWKTAMHVIKYCYLNRHTGITFRSDGLRKLRVYYDASHKEDKSDGHSLYSYSIFFCNGPIMWQSKKNAHEGLSSTHDEVQACYEATKAIVHVIKMIEDMGFDRSVTREPALMLGDNAQCVKYSREDYVSPGNRFYARNVRYIKRRVRDGTIDTRHLPGKDNIADLGTKSVGPQEINALVPYQTGSGGLLPEPPRPTPT